MSFDTDPSRQPSHIDQFLSDQERAGFAARREAVLETARLYGLSSDNAIIIGGGALALHGADTWVPSGKLGSGFDLDIIDIEANPPERAKRRMWGTPKDVVGGAIREAPLPLTRIRGLTAVNYARYEFKYPDYKSMVEGTVTIDDFATLPVANLVHGKAYDSDRMKDGAGIIKAHAVAEGTGHSALINDPSWRKAVAHVMGLAVERPAPRDAKRPEWLIKLIESGFDHPAFRDLRPKS